MNITKSFISAVVFAAIGASFLVPSRHANAVSINSGDLVRGQSFNAVYYMGLDSFRYVFPNDKTYFTWYENFNTVKFVSDAELAKIQIGGNVTYRPGVRMIKINSDSKTYAVDAGGELRHVGSEALAKELYGANWNKMIDDVPDGFFTNYSIGEAIDVSGDFNVSAIKSAASSINVDKDLSAAKMVSITDDGYSPLEINVAKGGTVKFTNNGSTKHSVQADDLTWGSGTLNPGDSFTKKFTKEDTYTFFDQYDSGNTGAIIVK